MGLADLCGRPLRAGSSSRAIGVAQGFGRPNRQIGDLHFGVVQALRAALMRACCHMPACCSSPGTWAPAAAQRQGEGPDAAVSHRQFCDQARALQGRQHKGSSCSAWAVVDLEKKYRDANLILKARR